MAGPNSTYYNAYSSVSLDVEQKVGRNLNLLFSANFYQQQIDQWNVAAARNVYRDLTPTLPDGRANPR